MKNQARRFLKKCNIPKFRLIFLNSYSAKWIFWQFCRQKAISFHRELQKNSAIHWTQRVYTVGGGEGCSEWVKVFKRELHSDLDFRLSVDGEFDISQGVRVEANRFLTFPSYFCFLVYLQNDSYVANIEINVIITIMII